jgi:UDP-3-O-[3-hydroxymyristoyl] glucosamine N-acyltransferase
MINPFFQNKGPLKIDNIYNAIKVENNLKNLDIQIFDIKDLATASTNEITFFHSKKYESVASTTKASYCLTTNKLSNILPKNCKPIEVDNVLVSTSIITSMFYPDAITDDFDVHTSNIEKTSFNNSVNHGQNILIGKNVKIGSNCSIGHNSIIESNVVIGDNCSIGSNVIIRNSLSNTIIGKNTFLDNQVHIAHNNKIGENCIIAGQVGFAGSSTLGNNVMIGGQAGISGHLKVGSNVQIGGGSGVIKDIPDNSKVMGYPAKDLKKFIKENK